MTINEQLTDTAAIPDVFAEQSDTKFHRILVAEDNDLNRALAQEILEFLGFNVHTVENGELAIKVTLTQTFDLILMDCQMPVMDGLEATRNIRTVEKEDGRTKTPIVALSGNHISQGLENCLEAGMDDYLQKPFTLSNLQEMISRWIPNPGLE
jgi:CheY-like chemotaxis protein